jgi:hypothetical protein
LSVLRPIRVAKHAFGKLSPLPRLEVEQLGRLLSLRNYVEDIVKGCLRRCCRTAEPVNYRVGPVHSGPQRVGQLPHFLRKRTDGNCRSR